MPGRSPPDIIPATVADYLPVLVFLVMIVAFGSVSLAMAALVRPSRPGVAKLQNYECGPEPIGPAWIRFPVKRSRTSRSG
jgi:NADH-quinone oxidoreductase subunit A